MKFVTYVCDGRTDAGARCTAHVQVRPDAGPVGWTTIALDARVHGENKGARGRDKAALAPGRATRWWNLCPACGQLGSHANADHTAVELIGHARRLAAEGGGTHDEF